MPAHAALRPRLRRWFLLVFLLVVLTTPLPLDGAAQEATPPTVPGVALDDTTCPAPEAGSERGRPINGPVYDYAMVIDVSGSMANDNDLDGIPDGTGPVIFPEVKEAIARYVDGLPLNSNLLVIPFSKGVEERLVRSFTLDSRALATRATAYIEELPATGPETHITDAVAYAIDRLQRLRERDDDPKRVHVQTVLLYTDGVGNGPGDRGGDGLPSADDLLERLDAYRTDQPFLFVKYVGLGVEVANRDQLEAGGVEVVEEQSGQVGQIRELRLALAGADLGQLLPGQSAAGRLCVVGGDINEPVLLRLVMERDALPRTVDLQLLTRSAVTEAGGVPIRWALGKGSETVPVGDYAAFLGVASSDPVVILVPSRLPVQFEIVPPPTPPPTVPPTPTATPTATPEPTSTPSPTPDPTPTPQPTPTPEPTSTPEPTPTPIPIAGLTVGPWTTTRVRTTGDPGGLVEWVAPVSADLRDGARPVLGLEVDLHDPPLPIDPEAFFRVGGQGEHVELPLDGNQHDVQAVVRTTAGALQSLGEGDRHLLTGSVVVDPQGGEIELPDGVRREDGRIAAPVRLEAKVYTPFDWGPIGLGALGLLAVASAGGAFLAARPALPAPAALVTGAGRAAPPFPLRQHQKGVVPRSVGVGSRADPVNTGLRQKAGSISGRWGVPHRARFVADRPVKVDGVTLQPGEAANLADGSRIQVDNQTIRYQQ